MIRISNKFPLGSKRVTQVADITADRYKKHSLLLLLVYMSI